MLINGSILKKLAPDLPQDKADKYAADLDTICPKYGIDTPDIMHEFIANLVHECKDFTRFEEGMNYQAVALTKLFGRHRISVDDCYRYGRTAKQKANQQMIANTIYGGAWGLVNLGNKQQGDGWMFRGSGFMQLTGRGLVTKFAAYYNAKFGTSFTPEQMAEMLRTNVTIGIHGACWFFAIEKKLIDEAINDEVLAMRKKINGGIFGLKEVKRLTDLARILIK